MSTSGPIATMSSADAADVQYVFPFENRGRDAGVTLHHPHGQIYGYPFVPPLPARELALQARAPRTARPRTARGAGGARKCETADA